MKRPSSGVLDQKMTVSKILFTSMSFLCSCIRNCKVSSHCSASTGVAVICAIQTLDQVKKIQLDSIMLGNCAHQIIFGRVSTTEMDIFSKMAGETLEHVTQETVTETAITAELPAYSYSRRSTPTLPNVFLARYSGIWAFGSYYSFP